MKVLSYSLLISSCVMTGCGAYEMSPLATTHPAHAQAMVAPEPPLSRTLAYTRADIPSQQSVSAQAVRQQNRPATAAAAAQTVEGEGKIVATVPGASQIVVEHGEIKGFMDAMTMGYRAEPSTLLEGLKSGDKIRFTINVANNAIIKIEKIK